ncbi:uncharacterized protein LOC125863873 [Solanum stenotomum]|uniref:uncharacterized protein LOC125863873 n=1 Tax=Solanum stenotomum TaxID=172797 RepID=UPI0020D03AD2|nr:uncharacterized protein LOC125863873 [Solanum stenotomum]
MATRFFSVKSAIFGIDINKSPGPDGYGSGFFRAAWTVIGQDVTQAILEFMETWELLTQLNSTRLKEAIKVVVASNQAAFVEGRSLINNLVVTCVTTTRFTVKVNGEGYGYFVGKRGLRQGDPISPLLFVLVMAYLTRILRKMSDLADVKYHPMCK